MRFKVAYSSGVLGFISILTADSLGARLISFSKTNPVISKLERYENIVPAPILSKAFGIHFSNGKHAPEVVANRITTNPKTSVVE